MARDYVILNGRDSRAVKGLLIQSLPPITKPQIRAEFEEIDGVDGDLATVAGYAAYDREMLIGLHGDFDVDAVFKFFNSSGVAIFSNEPLKAYQYAIYEPIDLEKLLRFRQGTVTFHVQPFKSLVGERPLNYQTDDTVYFYDDSIESNGIRAVSNSGSLSVFGTATGAGQILMQFDTLRLDPGMYSIMAYCDGTGGGISAALTNLSETNTVTIGSVPDDDAAIRTFAIGREQEYDAIKLSFSTGANPQGVFFFSVTEARNVAVTNSGNVAALPTITLTGSGSVDLLVNEEMAVRVRIAEGKPVTINAGEMEAYTEDGYANRQCVGDYAKLALHPGVNYFGWRGNVTGIKVENYNRWV